ncbi:hypothetical protein, partial [Streptomyces cyaneofuscatus]
HEGLLISVEMSQSTPNPEALTHIKNPARVSPMSRYYTPSALEPVDRPFDGVAFLVPLFVEAGWPSAA